MIYLAKFSDGVGKLKNNFEKKLGENWEQIDPVMVNFINFFYLLIFLQIYHIKKGLRLYLYLNHYKSLI
jgi:hypothetical protein